MLTLNDMKKIRKKKNMSYEEIARNSGVSISSVQKIFGSENSNPRHSTLEKLSRAFNPLVSGGAGTLNSMSGYTYEDYLAMELPEGKRVEIIDGVIYDMAAPTQTHQAILGYLHNYISNELRKRKRRCLPFVAPFDVRLDFSDGPTTVVQPDLLVKCSQDSRTDENGEELPWVPRFVVEILSPSSRSKDMYIKTKKYQESGIVEYWMIDDKSKQVIKYNFEKDSIEIFGYESKIPIDIFDGDIKVDMKELQNYLDEYADLIDT